MKRRLVIALCVVLVLVGCLAGGAVVFRRDLAQALIAGELASRGLAPVHFTVADITTRRVHLTGFSVGAEQGFRADDLIVHFRLAALLHGEVEQVELSRPVLRLDATGERPLLGDLQPLIERLTRESDTADGSAGPPAPPVVIDDARVEARTSLGAVTLGLEGAARPRGPGAWSVDTTWLAKADFGQAAGRLEATLTADLAVSGRVEIESGQVHPADLVASLDSARGMLTFSLSEGRLVAATAEIDLLSIVMPGRGTAKGQLSLSAAPSRLAAAGRVATDGDALALTFDLGIEDYPDHPRVSLNVEGAADAQAPFWGFLPIPAPASGRATVALKSNATLISPGALPRDPESLWTWLSDGSFGGTLEVNAQVLAFTDRIGALSGRLALEANLADQRAEIAVLPGGRLDVSGLSPAWLESLAVPPDMVAMLSAAVALEFPEAEVKPLTITADLTESPPVLTVLLSEPRLRLGSAELRARGQARLALTSDWRLASVEATDLSVEASNLVLAGVTVRDARVTGDATGSPSDLSGRAELSLRVAQGELGGVTAEGIVVTAPLSWRHFEDSLEAMLERPASLHVDRMAQAGVFATTGALTLPLAEGQGRFTAGREWSCEVTLAPAKLGLAVERGDASALALAATLKRLRLDGRGNDGRVLKASAQMGSGEVRLPELGLSLALPSVAVTHTAGQTDGGGRTEVRLDEARLARDGSPDTLAPLVLTGAVEHVSDELRFTGTLGPTGNETLIALRARHHPGRGVGNLLLRVPSLDFSAGAPQPGDLIPALSKLRFSAGRGEAEARLSWTPGGLESGGRATLTGAALKSGELSMTGLNLSLTLDDLLAPSSPPGQSLSFKRLDVGIPVEELDGAFRLVPEHKVLIERATFRLLSGAFLVRDALVDPASAGQRISFQMGDMSLEEVLGTLKVEGLSGSGTLAGTIPLVIEQDKVLVEGARLEATGPGVLRYTSDSAALALRSGGESVELMLQALEDFRYQELTLDADMDGEDQLTMQLSILGHNPRILDGHPFRFNINLTSDLSPLLAALRQGYELTDNLFKRTWNLGR